MVIFKTKTHGMESQTNEKPKDVETADSEEQEDDSKTSEQQHPPTDKDDSCYLTFAIVTFWQGRVAIAFRCILLILALAVVIAAAVAIENTYTPGRFSPLPVLQPLFRWLLAASSIHMIYEGLALCICFWKFLFLKRITKLLIIDIVVSVILMVAYFATGPPVAKDVRDVGQITCSKQQSVTFILRSCQNIYNVYSAGIAACVFLYLSFAFLIAKVFWSCLFLRKEWYKIVEENSKPMPCFRCRKQ